MTREERKQAKVIAAHMPVGLHNYFGECNYMTFLRDPIERVISSYYANAESQESPTYYLDLAPNRTLLQFGEQYVNLLTRYLVTCAFSSATFWLSGETNPSLNGVSYLGLDCVTPVSVRTIALQQWNAPTFSTQHASPCVMGKVAVEFSNDNFETDIHVASVLDLKQDRGMYSYEIPACGKRRFWRIRALSEAPSARWGVVALRFFEQEQNLIPPSGYEHLAIRGVPLCSSAVKNYPATNAFDGRDLLAQWQIPSSTLTMSHCEEAMNNLRERFIFGFTERYDESIGMIGKALGWSSVPVHRLNVNPIRRNANILSDYEKKELAEMNRFDIFLHQYAQKLFQSDLRFLQSIDRDQRATGNIG